MKLLTIETTCDETAAAVVTDRLEVLSSVVATQEPLHERFGGVVPEIASRAHLERILPVIDQALRRAGLSVADLDAVAVANTPGLAGSLLVGLAAAKALCVAGHLPLLAVNHLHAHIYACRLAAGRDVFPCLGLIVSGGHTSLYRCHSPVQFELLGGTIDDAAGEAFDKVANLLGLPFPGGPAIERAAREGNRAAFPFRAHFCGMRRGWSSVSADSKRPSDIRSWDRAPPMPPRQPCRMKRWPIWPPVFKRPSSIAWSARRWPPWIRPAWRYFASAVVSRPTGDSGSG